MTRLPNTADIEILGWSIEIRNHQVVNYDCRFFDVIMDLVSDVRSDRETLYQFEKHGISFEMVVEECVKELEEDTLALVSLIFGHYKLSKIVYADKGSTWLEKCAFSAGRTGRKIVDRIVEKIRDCNDWGELYDEMNPESRFHKEIIKKIKEVKNNVAKFDTTARRGGF